MKYKAKPFDIWQSVYIDEHEPLSRYIIAFATHIDPDVLAQAVELSKQTLPMVGCGLEGGFFAARWVDKGFSGKDIVRVVPMEGDLHSTLLQCFTEPIDFAQQSHVRLYIIREESKDTLCITVSHILCDGTGLKEYVRLLGILYTACSTGGQAPEQQFHERGTRPLLANYRRRDILRLFAKDSKYNPYKYTSRMKHLVFPPDGGEARPNLILRELSGERWAGLRQYAQGSGTTLNDILLAAFARSVGKAFDMQVFPMSLTVDMRKMVPEGTSYGITNLTSACMCDVRLHEGDTLADTATQIDQQMAFFRNRENTMKPVLLVDFLSHVLPYRPLLAFYRIIASKYSSSLSNTGVLRDDARDFAGLPVEKSFIVSQVFRSGCFHVVVSTFRDCCSLTCATYASPERRAMLEGLLDRLVSELYTACGL
ncbi:MAG: condensation domain-containing protein [Clostridiales Family XIII bacterium]|jgi:NRPS condensation-like uncharacterized protein|nr:condensation domain-containing protein [Clostridiales Family XIII bacterium]